MSQFGQLVRNYRNKCEDPQNGQRLSQERLGELLGEALGDHGYTGQAVSYWERGESKIHADNRRVLVGLIEVLHRCGGLQSLSEANALLAAGNYRPLDDDERRVFPDEPADSVTPSRPTVPASQGQIAGPPWGRVVFQLNEELDVLLAQASEGPSPRWPRVLAALLRWPLDHLTSAQVMATLFWIWTWLFTWWLIIPSLRWPFMDREQAGVAMVLYTGGTLISPLLVGALTTTRNDKFWRQHHLEQAPVTRLYTYQGAFIGFHLGYATIVVFSLGGYYLGVGHVPRLDWAAAVLPVGLSYVGARLVPYNLWRAYGRLRIGDGAVFFIFLLLGPGWGMFFFKAYPWLLTPVVGLLMGLSTVTILAGMAAWRRRRTGASIIPSHWWLVFYGVILVLYEATRATALFSVVSLAGLIIALAVLFARGQIYITLAGSIGLLIGSGLVFLCFRIHVWLGAAIAGVIALAWWRWGRNLFRLPSSFWGLVLALGVGSWLVHYRIAFDVPVSLAFSVITLTILWRGK